MDYETRRKWSDALLSGDFNQIPKRLKSKTEQGFGYCCLGVLWEVMEKPFVEFENSFYISANYIHDKGISCLPPNREDNWLIGTNGHFYINEKLMKAITPYSRHSISDKCLAYLSRRLFSEYTEAREAVTSLTDLNDQGVANFSDIGIIVLHCEFVEERSARDDEKERAKESQDNSIQPQA